MSENTSGAAQRQRPALIIGLGGTGKQVLLNLRRMYYERYGSTHPAHVGHIWVDTDTRNVTLDGRELDFLMREVDFDETEKVSVELKKADLQTIYDHPEGHPHIFAWFDKRLQKHGEIRDGAGQIRSFGRLAFVRYYEDIMRCVREKQAQITRARTHNQALSEQGIELESTALDVWLILSVAGGTGSGMFIDFAFAVRHQWPNATVRGIIVLPSVFSHDPAERIYGNAYAALMELEHYNYGSNNLDSSKDEQEDAHLFALAWNKQMYNADKRARGPVFDTTYLIDNRPDSSKAGNIPLEDKNALCKMIAEWLYIEYGSGRDVSSLGLERRTAEVNFSSVLNEVFPYRYVVDKLEFSETFSCRYSSFGLSKLYIPVDRVIAEVQHKLVRDMIAFWTTEREVPAGLDTMLENDYLKELGVDNRAERRDFLKALDTGGTGKRLTQHLEDLIGDRRQQFLSGAGTPQSRKNLSQWIQESLLKEQLNREDANQERWGSMAKTIVQYSKKHYELVIAKIHDFIANLLAEPDYRFEVAREALRRIRDRLNNDARHFEDLQEKNRQAGYRSDKEIKKLLQWLDDVKGRFTRRTLVEVILEETDRRLKRELQAQIAGEAAGLAKRVADYIGRGVIEKNAQGEEVEVETGLLKQLIDYQKTLKTDVITFLDERLKAYGKVEHSPIYQELSAGTEELKHFYVDSHNRPITKDTVLPEWERDFFEAQKSTGVETQNLWLMRKPLKARGTKFMVEELLEFARTAMRHLEEKNLDVLERLGEHYKPDTPEYQRQVDNLRAYAQPWLRTPEHYEGGALANKRNGQWVARSEDGNPTYRQVFEAALEKQGQGYQLVSCSPDKVYAAAESAGFPLMVIPGLDRYRDKAYQPLLEKDEVLHTDLNFEQFQDLLIKNQSDVQHYVETLQTFLDAMLLGAIKAEKRTAGRTAMMEFNYVDNTSLYPEDIRLGAFSVAVTSLARGRATDLFKKIKDEVNDQLTSADYDTRLRWGALLAFHANSPRSYFHRFDKEHPVRVILRGKYKTLDYDAAAQSAAKEELNTLTDWAVEYPEASGIYTLDIRR